MENGNAALKLENPHGFYPFGMRLAGLSTGQEYDSELDLHNFRARFYDSDLMRFYSMDPEEEFSSPYLFCGNNPINLIDPTGKYITLTYDNKGNVNQMIDYLCTNYNGLDFKHVGNRINITRQENFIGSITPMESMLLSASEDPNVVVKAVWMNGIDIAQSQRNDPNKKTLDERRVLVYGPIIFAAFLGGETDGKIASAKHIMTILLVPHR
jgi:RHS repeat-associated protein